jgi:hypothetical protein
LPVAQQNALVQKYCAVCHDDRHRNGGLSLQNFDASRAEPSLAAMMVSKLETGALGAAGFQYPDKATEQGLLDALMAKSTGAEQWTLTRTQDPGSKSQVLVASILRKSSSTTELYRLKLSCRTDTREAEMQLSWSPKPADSPRSMLVAVDNASPTTYTVEGHVRMGNGLKKDDGSDVMMGPAAAVLSTRLPNRTLTVSNLFPDESVTFPFDSLIPNMRQELSPCFR